MPENSTNMFKLGSYTNGSGVGVGVGNGATAAVGDGSGAGPAVGDGGGTVASAAAGSSVASGSATGSDEPWQATARTAMAAANRVSRDVPMAGLNRNLGYLVYVMATVPDAASTLA